MNSYLTERKQFAEIDDKRSPLPRVYNVSLKAVFWGLHCLTFRFMIYLKVQLVNVFNVLTTLYHHCKVKDITEKGKLLETNINSLES